MRVAGMDEDLLVLFEPSVHPVPVESHVAGDGRRLVEGLLVTPDGVVGRAITGGDAPVAGVALEGAMRAAAGWGQQLRAPVVARAVVDRRVPLLEPPQPPGAVGDGFPGDPP